MVGQWYRNEITWQDFEEAYLLRLNGPSSTAVDELINLAQDYLVIATCVENTPDQCHRRLLAEECRRRCPELFINIQ